MSVMSKAALTALALSVAVVLASCASEPQEAQETQETAIEGELEDKPYELVMDYQQDYQYPELPTGCEATALSTLMRMNGYYVTKVEVADAMPKSDGEDFVEAFWGDPYTKSGWACMAPCSVKTANGFFEVGEEYAAIDMTGTALADVPTPFCAWVTIDMAEPVPSGYVQDGYTLMRNPHCVTVTAIDGESVAYIDPLLGYAVCPQEWFEYIYDAMGRQSVYIDRLDEVLRIQREQS